MNLIKLIHETPRAALAIAIGCIVLISGCGGGGGGGGSSESAGIGGTGISVARGFVQGEITGFGSVHVNGGKFETTTSQFIVDGNSSATQANLKVGMVVRLEVETENGVFNGTAIKVVYDDEIEGPLDNVMIDPVDATRKIGDIFGQTVYFSEFDTVYENTSFANLSLEDDMGKLDVIEVSGFRTSPTDIVATYVRFEDDLDPGFTEVELRGSIDVGSLMGTAPTQTFVIDGVTITTDIDTEIEVPGGLAEMLYVEVEGVYQNATNVLAKKVEFEDDDLGNEVDKVSLQGVISTFTDLGNFEIDGQPVDASMAILSPASIANLLGAGFEVEVEGDIVGGVLLAEELELREAEAELRSFVSTVVDNSRFRVSFTGLPGSVMILTDGNTEFEDNGPTQLPNLTVVDLNPGDFVDVEGIEVANEVVASSVKREDSMNPDDSKLEGDVDAAVLDTSITVLGITFNVDLNTTYEDESGDAVSSNVFFNQLIGKEVEIEDEVTADGTAEEVSRD